MGVVRIDPKGARLGWIGLGKIGLPMAQNLVADGASLKVFDVDPARTALLKGSAVSAASGIADACRDVDVIFSAIPKDAELRAVALGPDGVLASATCGAVFIDTSTVSPEASAEVAAAAKKAGVHYLRVTVSGNNTFAERRILLVMASGEREVWERVRPLLDCFGDKQHFVGEHEEARACKLVLNLMIACTAGMMAEGLALGRRAGIDPSTLLSVIAASAVGSPIIKAKQDAIRARDFQATLTASQMIKDLDLILAQGRQSHVPLSMTSTVYQMLQSLVAQGLGEDDYIATIKLLEQQSGLAAL